MSAVPSTITNHPAETAAPVAMAAALLIAKAFDVDDVDTVAAIAIVLSFVPAAVTWVVLLMRGRGGPRAPAKKSAPTTVRKRSN